MGFQYLPSRERLGFAQGYNQGIAYFEGRPDVGSVILSANDIIVKKDTIRKFREKYSTYGDSAGCLIPYLSKSDYFIQEDRYGIKDRPVPVMTLNCNFFLKSDLLAIGKVPEYLSGYFNDVVMSSKIFDAGKKIILCKGIHADHLANRTVSVSSSANYEKDKTIFFQNHADLTVKRDFSIIAERFTKSRFEIFFSKVERLIPARSYQNAVRRLYKTSIDLHLFLHNQAARLMPMTLKQKWKRRGQNKALETNP